MPVHKIEIAPDVIAEGRRLYERTLTPLRDIAALMGISNRTLDNRVREWGWQRRRMPAQPVALHHAARGAIIAAMTGATPAGEATDPVPGSDDRRAAIAAQIQDAVTSALDAVKRTLDKLDPADSAEAERAGRALAGVSRTLRELAAVNQPPEASSPHETDNDPVPSDIDEFRVELTQRIRRFVAAQRDEDSPVHGGPAAGVD